MNGGGLRRRKAAPQRGGEQGARMEGKGHTNMVQAGLRTQEVNIGGTRREERMGSGMAPPEQRAGPE